MEIIGFMNRNYLGEVEELILSAVAVLDGQAYAKLSITG
jgi:hypothetical protein